MEAAQHPWPALGVLLLRDGLVTKDDLTSILDGQRDSRQKRIASSRLGEILVERGVVSAVQVARLLAEQYELPFVELTPSDIDLSAARAFTVDEARRFSAVPINRRADGSYDVAIADPSTVVFSDQLRGILDSAPHFVVVGSDAIAAAIAEAFSGPDVVVDHRADDTATVMEARGEDRDEHSLPRSGTLPQLWPPLGALLVRDGFVSDDELEAALAQQRVSTSQRLGEILVERGTVSPAAVARLVAEQYELPFAELHALVVDASIARLLPQEIARRYRAVPIRKHEDGSLDVAIADPTRVFYSDDLHVELEAPLRFVVAPPDDIDAHIARAYGTHDSDGALESTPVEQVAATPSAAEDGDTMDGPAEASESVASVSVIRPADVDDGVLPDELTDEDLLPPGAAPVVDGEGTADSDPVESEHLAFEALELAAPEPPAVAEIATDALLRPDSSRDVPEPVASFADSAAADLAEAVQNALDAGASAVHLWHQDDAVEVRARVGGALEASASYPPGDLPPVLEALAENPDVAIHALTTTRGSKITVSVVERLMAPASIAELGLTFDGERALRLALAQTGLTVVTGGPGSGVTSTLYAVLDELATRDRIVATVEDRIERLLGGVDQTEIDVDAGITFADGLRQLWDMDADVVLVSALPDTETATTAVRCALAGRHVLAGMSEADAASAVARLFELVGDSQRIGHALSCVVSQRLVPRVCEACRETYYASPSELGKLGLDPDDGHRLLARGRGCRTCAGSGSRGQTAVFEVLVVTDEIRQLAGSGTVPSAIRDAAAAAGVPTIRDEVVRLCLEGFATTAELDRLSETLDL